MIDKESLLNDKEFLKSFKVGFGYFGAMMPVISVKPKQNCESS